MPAPKPRPEPRPDPKVPGSATPDQKILDLKTLNDILFLVAARGDGTAVQRRTSAGTWESISGRQFYRAVVGFAGSLRQMGIVAGDRVAQLAENRWEWAVADFALLAIGAVGVPIYPTLTPAQSADLLEDSGSRIVIVSTRKQYLRITGVQDRTHVEQIIVMDDEDMPGALKFSTLMSLAEPGSTADEAEEAFNQRARDVRPHDLATIIYTSGTTGEPKGVMLTHANLASNLSHSSRGYEFSSADSCISFLPLSHITARHLDYVLLARGATLAYCPFFEQLPAAMASVRPTVFVAVPRVLEKVMQEVKRRSSKSPVKARLLAWARWVGKGHGKTIMAGAVPSSPIWKLANKLVYSKVRQVFGGRVRYFVCGGAPLGVDTAEWFADVGIQLLEGYGLTETSPAIALSSRYAARTGSVGPVLPNVEARIAEDGELLVRGPSVFGTYWQKPQATLDAFEDGWFRTGDVARIDDDGFLFITDRKKELLKTSGGKMIAPQPIESKLKADSLVAEAILVGDRHKFACALIAPNFAVLEEWAKAHEVAYKSRRELAAHPEVRGIYHKIVQATNAHLANFEKIKRFHVVADEWTIEGGEMTPSMKLKRRVILERYAREIDHFYADEAVAHE